jgi:HAD superfamily hydrolase (TIGR01490 family)
MPLAIFDLDETLLTGDSDHAWGEFVAAKGLVEPQSYRLENDRFYRDYKSGNLDIMAYLEFVLKPLAGMGQPEIGALQAEFMATQVEGMIAPKSEALIEAHRQAGDTLLMITATNDLITAPIAKRFAIPNLLASTAEVVDGKVTGRVSGTPSFREGKVLRLLDWLSQNGASLSGSAFYSDSPNDLPLLEAVSRPVAVDPHPELKKAALERGWEIISLR